MASVVIGMFYVIRVCEWAVAMGSPLVGRVMELEHFSCGLENEVCLRSA